MAGIRCPKCGIVTDQRQRGFPRCAKCGNYLYRCGLCRYYEDRSCSHPLIPPGFTVEPEAISTCGLFRPGTAADSRVSIFRRTLQAWRYLVLAALSLALGLKVLQMINTPRGGEPVPVAALVASGTCERQIMAGETGLLSLDVVNASDRLIPQLTLRICGECFRLLDMPPETISPLPARSYTEPDSGARRLTFGAMPPGAALSIRIGLRPVKQGRSVISLDFLSRPDQPLVQTQAHLDYRVQAVL